MKFASGLIMVMFVFFLSAPTIVSLIETSTDTSAFYNMTEEELTHKEIKAEISGEEHITPAFLEMSGSGKILSENLSRHDNVAATIFIPPPELI